jgi:hypothetical protein
MSSAPVDVNESPYFKPDCIAKDPHLRDVSDRTIGVPKRRFAAVFASLSYPTIKAATA